MIRWHNHGKDRQNAQNATRSIASGLNQHKRPALHFHPPAGWMNDPNGPLFINGLEHCFSGTAIRRADGRHLILFTAISEDEGMGICRGAQQWGALSDDRLLDWSPIKTPILTDHHHDGPVYEWRDPFCFQYEGRTYLLLGGNRFTPNSKRDGAPGVFLYEAEDETLEHWKYKGILFRHADKRLRSVECPAFFQVGDRWVLLASPYGPVEWYAGKFDPDGDRGVFFSVENKGIVDGLRYHYASTIVKGASDKVLLLGWVGGFPEGLGWNGVLGLPRQVTLSNGRLFQSPGVDLAPLVSRSWNLLEKEQFCGNVFRLRIGVKNNENTSLVFHFMTTEGMIAQAMEVKPGCVSMGKYSVQFETAWAVVTAVLFDRCMAELFTDTGECVTFVHELLPSKLRVRCNGGNDNLLFAVIDELAPVQHQ